MDFKVDYKLEANELWVTMMDMRYPLHLIDLLAKLYRKQLAKVRIAGALSEYYCFVLRKGSDKVVSSPSGDGDEGEPQ